MNKNLYPLMMVALGVLHAHGGLLIPGASLTNYSGNAYGIYADNGLDDSDPGWAGAAIDLDVTPINSLQGILDPGFFSSLTPGHMWYEVEKNQTLDSSFILNSIDAFHIGHSAYTHLVEESITMNSDDSFYLGFWIDHGVSSGPDAGDVFGWAELMYDGDTLHLLDSAAENDGVGIYAGQYQQVPEPSSVLLLTIGAGGILFYRRSKQRQQEQRTNRRSFQ